MSGYLSSIREYCKWCMCGNSHEIRKCLNTRCDFYPVRSGRGVKGLSNLMRIKRHCVECSGKIKAVSDCDTIECPLYLYRLGHNPFRKGIGRNAEQMKKIRKNSEKEMRKLRR